MKISALLCLALGIHLSTRSQVCRLSGTVADTSIKTIELYLLKSDGPYGSSMIRLSPGRFEQTIPMAHPVFALLRIGDRKQRLLLSSGRDLQLTINAGEIRFTGKAAVENQLVHTSVLDTVPFFVNSNYGRITLSGWSDSVIRPVMQGVEATRQRIERATIPVALKAILNREVLYAYQCYLSDLTRYYLPQAKNPYADTLAKLALQWQPLPDSLALESGYYANTIVDRHGHYALNAVARDKSGGREAIFERIGVFLGMPFPNVDSLIKRYGERPILPWLYAKRHLPAAIQDKVIFNLILEAGDGANLAACNFMLQEMEDRFPHSNYLREIKNVVAMQEHRVQQNALNKHISIHDISDNATVLQLMKSYAGKVVYLDMWGTWCGPCRQEMPYTEALKKRYAGKNIVFVYVALDNPENDKLWKEYLRLYNLEGEHYRIPRKSGERFWSDAKVAGIADLSSVPRYMIFDTQGKLVHAEAERPSSQQKLYEQLDKLL